MSTKAESIWLTSKSGDKEALKEHLLGASSADLYFEKQHVEWLHTHLSIAVCEGHSDIVMMLINVGMDIDYKDSERGLAALHWASMKGLTPTVQALLDKGAYQDIQSLGMMTPLHWASCKNHTSVVQILLDVGADMNIQDLSGRTALHCSAERGNIATTQALLDMGADIYATNKDGNTALHEASSGGHVSTVQALLAAGADRSVLNKQGKTAALVAKTPEISKLINTY